MENVDAAPVFSLTELPVPETTREESAPVKSEPMPVIEQNAIQAEASPVCPKCSATMVKRQAKNGPHAGKLFWACSTYPKCRQVVAVSEGKPGNGFP